MSRLYFKNDVYTLKSGTSVLDRLLDGGHKIPHSCRAGICHACKLQVRKGVVPKVAQRGLKVKEISEGYFLSCQCKPKEDLHVCLPTEVDKQYLAQVISLNKLNHNIIQLIVKLDQSMPFHPGQFINLWKNNQSHRSYSIANLPSQENLIEMHIRHMPNGELSSWVFFELKKGDSVSIQGPLGDCFYQIKRQDKIKPLLLAGTGTGLAPLHGILLDALKQNHQGKIYIYHGALSDTQLYYVENMKNLTQKHDNVYYIPVVLKSSGLIEGLTEGVFDEEVLNTTDSFTDWSIYLCGGVQMIKKIQKQVFLKGASLKAIHADAFIPYV